MEIIYLSLFVIVFIFIFLQFFPQKRVFKYPWMMTYFAHRGLYSKDQKIPENSLASFKEAMKFGYGIELDISLSKDLDLMVFHDDDLKRMCHCDLKVTDVDMKTLKSMRLKESNESIPTLFEVLDLVNGSIPIMIELKSTTHRQFIVSKLKDLLSQYKGDLCVVSFDPLILMELKKQMPYVLRGQIVENFMNNKKYNQFTRFLLTYSLFNFLTRPDFLSFDYKAINITYRVHKLLKGFGAIWAINSLVNEKDFQNDANAIIFEHYHPQKN